MLENFLHQFGYVALVLGTFIEGEASVLLGAYLALQGYLKIEWVAFFAFCGTLATDQWWYFLGRRHGRRLLAKNPKWQKAGDKALRHLRRNTELWVLSFRFIYGMRMVMPIAIGLSGYSWRRYLLLDSIAVAIWSIGISYAAYHLGSALQSVLGDLRRYEFYLLGSIAVIGLSLWLYKLRAARKRREVLSEPQAADGHDHSAS